MECNKDEAIRAKEIAERKVTQKNYTGAKKFAVKAQKLYPGLCGISQMLMTIDVYIAAEKKINGEVDWYVILGTNPWDDYETVRKQDRKLALLHHPDKNKAAGADGAFKLVSEAWRLLADKAKRITSYDKSSSRCQQKYPTQTGVSFASLSANGIHTSTKNATSQATTWNNAAPMSSTSVPSSNQIAGTFWTTCDKCQTYCKYLRMYVNKILRCPHCGEALPAVEKPPPPVAFKCPNSFSRQQHQNSRHHSANSKLYNSGEFSGLNSSKSTNPLAGINIKFSSSAAAQAENAGHQMHEKLKRACDEAQEAAFKKRRGDMGN